ncbi:GNAT family N-acetyltransferase [Paucibacter sp. O1-1]|nr:GNAT family N-acetyltransferase [Paucibacter sp. O1-1]MDA3830856.1 GNAT family N-acetyltransferase [Paucibacter sp. O1-1]
MPILSAIENDQLIGFRLTYAAGQWPQDQWCTVDKWGVAFEDVCYFKSNTIAESARGKGLGGQLLAASKAAVIAQGAKAGVSHLWQQSPNNAAVRYFTKAGGVLIAEHPQRWHQRYMGEEYICVICDHDCHCVACEMLLTFWSRLTITIRRITLCMIHWLTLILTINLLRQAIGRRHRHWCCNSTIVGSAAY